MEKRKENINIDAINIKIKQLKNFFNRNCIVPELIVICKSFKSNYTDDVVKEYMRGKL